MLAYAVTEARPQLLTVIGDPQPSVPPPGTPQDDGRVTFFLSTYEQKDVESLPDAVRCDITNLHRVNDVRYINKFFKAVNKKLPSGGFYTGCAVTIGHVKKRIFEQHSVVVAWALYILFFIARRVLPKLSLTKRLYFHITNGKNRALSKAEILGRLVCCGFEIHSAHDIGDQLYFTARKVGQPGDGRNPSYGPIFRMKRRGKGGNEIDIFKFRTMYPFSEYIQSYVYEKNNLSINGKFNDDFRVSMWGKYLRKIWVDELPMLVNWMKGDIKLVGVRPLSEHYFSLYPPSLAKKRLEHKPGLIPPFYADMPERFEQILDSETKYFLAYEQHPVKTDAKYLCKAMYNIMVKGARSA